MMTEVLRPYQRQGLEFLLAQGRAALFDEPGLGKSMQALLAMRELTGPKGQILIVCTGDALGVWQDETEKWLDEPSSVFAGPGAKLSQVYDGVTITNYHRFATMLDSFQWDGVIFDECQMLRNRNTRTLFKAARYYFDKSRYGLNKIPAFFLSGSPIVKHTGDLWPILHLIDKARWPSYWAFVNKYCSVWHDFWGWHVEGVIHPKELRAEVEEVGLWRTVAEVQPQLPLKVRKRVRLQMTKVQAKLYRQLDDDMIAEVGGNLFLTPTVLAKETRLRQVLVTPRLLGVDDDGAALTALRDIAGSHSRPLVVFTPFAKALPHLARALDSTSRPVYQAHGGMGARFDEVISRFNEAAAAGDAPVLASTVWMGKSWSVSRSSHECYMWGFDWLDVTQTQAEARLRRDGQTETVFSRYFVHDGSHDMEALEVLSGRKRLADVILGRKGR